MENKEFIIYRPNWLQGREASKITFSAMYLMSIKKMCCLGQIAHQCGVPLNDIRGTMTPGGISNSTGAFDDLFVDTAGVRDNNALAEDAMAVNDDGEDTTREERLTNVFATEGIKITFSDEIAPWFREETHQV